MGEAPASEWRCTLHAVGLEAAHSSVCKPLVGVGMLPFQTRLVTTHAQTNACTVMPAVCFPFSSLKHNFR